MSKNNGKLAQSVRACERPHYNSPSQNACISYILQCDISMDSNFDEWTQQRFECEKVNWQPFCIQRERSLLYFQTKRDVSTPFWNIIWTKQRQDSDTQCFNALRDNHNRWHSLKSLHSQRITIAIGVKFISPCWISIFCHRGIFHYFVSVFFFSRWLVALCLVNVLFCLSFIFNAYV